MQIHPLLKNKWFWVSLVLLFIFALIFDFTLAGFVLVHNLTSGKWSTMLLELGALYSGITVYRSYLHKADAGQIKVIGRVVLLIIAVLAFKNYGFGNGLNFLITVFIFSNVLQWIAHRIYKRKKKVEWI